MDSDFEVFAFEVSVAGTDWSATVNERSAGRAKGAYHRCVIDAWPNVPFTAMRARKLGAPQSSPGFLRCAEYRGVGLRCGQKVSVRCGDSARRGVVVGHNDSANFDVLFFDTGQRLNVHPSEITAE